MTRNIQHRPKSNPIHLSLSLLFCTLASFSSLIHAQQWPTKAVRIIVPFPPGQAADIIARSIAERLTPVFGQAVMIDNRPGAGAALGTELAAKSAPDGYTFLAGGTAALAINPHLYPKIGYDTLRDFAPVSQLVGIGMVFTVTPSLPARNLQALISLARQKPKQLNYGSSGSGSTSHLVTAMLASRAGIELTHIPYKGAIPALTDLMAGQVMLVADTTAVTIPLIKAQKIRALAISTEKRLPQLPDLATVAEQGYPGYHYQTWTSIVAPANTPTAIVERMSNEIVKIIQQPEVNKRLTEMGFIPVGSPREQATAFIKAEYSAWQKAVHISGAKVD